MKFKIAKIIITDDEGFLILKGLLPPDSILWSRSIEGEVAVYLSDYIDLEYLEKNLNILHSSVHRAFMRRQ